jgi:TRAP-type C4-dicarboxylate transport system substrate-binding protein
MKRSAIVKCLVVTLVMFLFMMLSSTAQAQQKTITLNYSNFAPATHKTSVLSEEWCKEVEKRTNGLVKATMFHGGTLTPPTQAYDGVVKGLSDMAQGVFSYHRGRFPLTEFSDLPLGVRDCVVIAKMFNEYHQKFKPKEMDDVKVMYLHGNPPAILHTAKKPVNKLEDIKGLKIRVTPNGTPIVKALGAAPVAMPMPEVYDSLSKGVVDGGMLPSEALEGWKLGEVVKYTTETYSIGYTSAFYVIMNKQKWDSIPPDTQKVIEKINQEFIEKTGKGWEEIDASGRACRNWAADSSLCRSRRETAG